MAVSLVPLALPGPLVSTAWLAQHLEHPGLVLIDATKYLPTEGLDGARGFEDGHIRGARFFDIDLFADPETDLPHMAPSAGRFARLAGAAGIGHDSIVVVYDQKGQSSAARAWWLLRLFGHGAVALLEGGLPRWRREGRTLRTGPAAAAVPAVFSPRLRTTLLTGLGDLLRPEPGRLVLDARPAGRFAGLEPEPRPGLQPGHIPGSRNIPATSLLDADGSFLPRDTLRTLFDNVGAEQAGRIVTTCGTGVTAAMLAFGLMLAGLADASVYDGSWAEWGGRPDTPKETGVR